MEFKVFDSSEGFGHRRNWNAEGVADRKHSNEFPYSLFWSRTSCNFMLTQPSLFHLNLNPDAAVRMLRFR